MTQRHSALHPSGFVPVKSLRVPKARDDKLLGRSNSAGPARDQVQVSREDRTRRQGCYCRAAAPRGDAGEHLDTTTRIQEECLGRHVAEEESSPVRCLPVGKREDSVSLRKHLGRARRLVSAVKQGRCYFHLLQKEEQEEQEQEERRRRRREEQLRAEPRPPCFSSESDSDSDGWRLPAGSSWSDGNEARRRRKKVQSARPFTPVHRSLTSPLLSDAPREAIYRQLCCLNWLLEALTEGSGRAGPLTSCWDPKDPGRGRTTPKTLNKERAIQIKWEQFVSGAEPRRTGPRVPRSSSGRLHGLRKSSSLSVASVSAITTPTVGDSLSSLGPSAEEETGIVTASQDVASSAVAEETEPPPSECLRTLLDEAHQSVKKDLYGQRTSGVTHSCPATTKPLSASSRLVDTKASRLLELRAAYEQRAEETAQSYADVLEYNARKRLNRGLQKYRALRHVTGSHRRLPRHVTCPSGTEAKTPETGAPAERDASATNDNKRSNNMWLSTLLSSLPAEVCKERAVSRVLEKLSGFADEQTPRVRPHLFLKVLGGLRPWELCLPDLCVAIEIAREHVVQMPREEYDDWLCSRVPLPSQYCHENQEGLDGGWN